MIGALFGFEFRPYRYSPLRVSPLVGRLAINCHAAQTERAVRSVSGQTARVPPVILPVVSKPKRRLGASPCRKKNFKTRRSNRRLSLVYTISARRATTPYSLRRATFPRPPASVTYGTKSAEYCERSVRPPARSGNDCYLRIADVHGGIFVRQESPRFGHSDRQRSCGSFPIYSF